MKDSMSIDNSGKGIYMAWFDDGKPSVAGRFSEGMKKEGKWKYYHKNGNVSSIELFNGDKLIDKQYFDEAGNAVADTTTKEVEAIFKGGMSAWQKYLAKNIYFPPRYKIANADKVVVVVRFVVDEEGKVENAYVNTPFDAEFDDIALRVINKSPKWIPALQNNRHVKYFATQPVVFAQEEW